MEKLHQRVEDEEWDILDQRLIDSETSECRKLQARIAADGRHSYIMPTLLFDMNVLRQLQYIHVCMLCVCTIFDVTTYGFSIRPRHY